MKRFFGKMVNIILTSIILSVTFLSFCGFGKKTVTLDVSSNPVYISTTPNILSTDFAQGAAAKKCVSFYGKVVSVSDEGIGKEVYVSADGTVNKSVKVKLLDRTLLAKADRFTVGSDVVVYGKVKPSVIPMKDYYVQAFSMDLSENEYDADVYRCMANGSKTYTSSSIVRTIGPKISYRIPETFASVEQKLPNIEGYEYKLNQIAGQAKVDPEQLYVFWFDYEKYLLNIAQDRDNTSGIEKAIVENILRNESFGTFPAKKITSDDDIAYHYYMTTFTDSLREYHNVEFVFIPIKDKGIVVYLYVFTTSDHKDDILMLMNGMSME